MHYLSDLYNKSIIIAILFSGGERVTDLTSQNKTVAQLKLGAMMSLLV